MYGYKGGSKSDCTYPTIKNVRSKFYEVYPGVCLAEYNPRTGEIPIVGEQRFRYTSMTKKILEGTRYLGPRYIFSIR